METSSNQYDISFFKPANEHAKANRNMVIWLVIIWVVAIFGFHILLKIVSKPTPETAYTEYQQVWENVQSNQANAAELQTFAKSSLSVLGKIFIAPAEKASLNNALSWSVAQLADSAKKAQLKKQLVAFQQTKDTISVISSPVYIEQKNQIAQQIEAIVAFDESDVRRKLAPIEVMPELMDNFTDESKAAMPAIMSKYLIHNQSFLTDTKFLGFPFHYFYTAVFLLILFVVLCIVYCKKTEKINIKFGVEN